MQELTSWKGPPLSYSLHHLIAGHQLEPPSELIRDLLQVYRCITHLGTVNAALTEGIPLYFCTRGEAQGVLASNPIVKPDSDRLARYMLLLRNRYLSIINQILRIQINYNY